MVQPAVLARMTDPGSQRGKAWNCLTVYLECKRSTGVHDSDPVTKTESRLESRLDGSMGTGVCSKPEGNPSLVSRTHMGGGEY